MEFLDRNLIPLDDVNWNEILVYWNLIPLHIIDYWLFESFNSAAY